MRLFLVLLMVVAVGRIQQHWRVIAMFRPALLLAVLTAVYALMNPKKLALEGLFRTWPARLVAALAIWACVSAPFGRSLGGSAKFLIEDYSKTVIFCFLLIAAIRCTRDLYTFVWSYVVSSAILVYFSIFVFSLKKESGSYAARISRGYTWDSNDLGLLLLVGLALTLLLFQTSRGRMRLFAGATIVGIGVARWVEAPDLGGCGSARRREGRRLSGPVQVAQDLRDDGRIGDEGQDDHGG